MLVKKAGGLPVLGDHLASFTDRESILSHFEQCVQSAQSGQLQVLAVKGISGTGKAFLIDYLIRHCLPEDWQTGQLTYAQATPDFRSILEDVEKAKNKMAKVSRKKNRNRRLENDVERDYASKAY